MNDPSRLIEHLNFFTSGKLLEKFHDIENVYMLFDLFACYFAYVSKIPNRFAANMLSTQKRLCFFINFVALK